jgi:hypothetical protein
MPEHVVDGLESIKIHKDETDWANRAAGDDVGEVPLQSTTIHQPGKRIMQGGKPQPGFGSSERAHILYPATCAFDGATHAKEHRATIGQGAVGRCKGAMTSLIKRLRRGSAHQPAKRKRSGTDWAGM